MQDLPQERLPVGAVEDRPQRQQLVQRRAERVDVGAVVDQDALAGRLLGAHVAQRAEQVAGLRQAGVGVELGQAEVGDPDVAAAVDQQVGRLDVAVDDAELVGVLQRLGRLRRQPGDGAEEVRGPVRRCVESRAQAGRVSTAAAPAGSGRGGTAPSTRRPAAADPAAAGLVAMTRGRGSGPR